MDPLPAALVPDLRLQQRAAAGDQDAIEALARQVWPDIRRWALLELGDRASADDASQEALVRLLTHVAELDVDRPIDGWLRTVVRNCCRDLRRREATVARPLEAAPSAAHDPDRDLDLSRSARLAEDALSRLSPRQREALDLVDRQGVPPTEAAGILGVADGTVRALLHQGRRALRSALADHPEIRSLLRDR